MWSITKIIRFLSKVKLIFKNYLLRAPTIKLSYAEMKIKAWIIPILQGYLAFYYWRINFR